MLAYRGSHSTCVEDYFSPSYKAKSSLVAGLGDSGKIPSDGHVVRRLKVMREACKITNTIYRNDRLGGWKDDIIRLS